MAQGIANLRPALWLAAKHLGLKARIISQPAEPRQAHSAGARPAVRWRAGILLTFVSLQPICLAASDDTAAFCDPSGKDFYRQQQMLAWQLVAPERIIEADYRSRVFEARLHYQDQDLFAYKVLMNIRGSASYVSVALMDRRQSNIDVRQLASQARMLLQDEARKLARERGVKEAFVTLSSSYQTIALWSWRSRWFFSVDASERFSVFELADTTVEYVCTYQQ